MTLIGQHARSGYNVPENSREGVKNGNVDKIRRRQKKQKVHFFLDFQKTKNTFWFFYARTPGNQYCLEY